MKENQREYGSRFPQEKACYINWGLIIELSTPPTEQKEVQIADRWQEPSGLTSIGEGASIVVAPDSPTTLWVYGKHRGEPGRWPVGKHRVDLFIENQRKISRTFEIHADSQENIPDEDLTPRPTPHQRDRRVLRVSQ